jgi:hypothetical protein
LSSRRDHINRNRGRIPENNNTSNRSRIYIGNIFPIPKSQPVKAGNPRDSQLSFKQAANIHTIFLHEANHLMLFQRIIKTPDIPAVYNHGDAGEGMTLLLPGVVLLL